MVDWGDCISGVLALLLLFCMYCMLIVFIFALLWVLEGISNNRDSWTEFFRFQNYVLRSGSICSRVESRRNTCHGKTNVLGQHWRGCGALRS